MSVNDCECHPADVNSANVITVELTNFLKSVNCLKRNNEIEYEIKIPATSVIVCEDQTFLYAGFVRSVFVLACTFCTVI